MPETEVTQVEQMGSNYEVMIQTNTKVNIKKMTPAERGDLVHTVTQGMIQEGRAKDVAWVKLGMYWAFILKNKLYRYCGDHIRNANDFLRDVDLGVGRKELKRYAELADIFSRILRTRNVEVPLRKLAVIQMMIAKGGDPEVWTDKAIALPLSALEDECREARGLQPRDTCGHPEEQQEVWMRCGCCGKWLEQVRN